jgi:hypothetical protein
MRQRLNALQHSAGTAAATVITRGEVNEVIAETVRRRDADLVVTGRGAFSRFLPSLFSHLYDIIRSSPCAVLVLKDAEVPANPEQARIMRRCRAAGPGPSAHRQQALRGRR